MLSTIYYITHHILPGWRARRSSRCSRSAGSASKTGWLQGDRWRRGRSWRRNRSARCVYYLSYHTLLKCKVCANNLIDSVFLPCGHIMSCTLCGLQLVNCPICKKRIAKVKKIYRAWALQCKFNHTYSANIYRYYIWVVVLRLPEWRTLDREEVKRFRPCFFFFDDSAFVIKLVVIGPLHTLKVSCRIRRGETNPGIWYFVPTLMSCLGFFTTSKE